MSTEHTPGPLTVSVNDKWPFRIVTKNSDGVVVFTTDLPCYSTSHECAADAIVGVGMPEDWGSAEVNARAIADEVLRAAAPELLKALKMVAKTLDEHEQGLMGNQFTYEYRDWSSAVRAAIAKAEGGEA